MVRYWIGRLLRGVLSVVAVVGIVMVLVYGFMDRNLIFSSDPVYSRLKSNAKEVYKLQQWENYGYMDYIPYAQWLSDSALSQQDYDKAVKLGNTAAGDSAVTSRYVQAFTEELAREGYQVVRLDAQLRSGTKKFVEGGEPRLYAYRDIPLVKRLWRYLGDMIQVDTVQNAQGDVGQRGLEFTWFDPAYGGEKFSPAILGNGTTHRYLLYFDDRFPFVHQNFITLRLGQSYSVNQGVDVSSTMTDSQGARVYREVTYPSGVTEYSADDLHSAVYVQGSYEAGDSVVKAHFVDDYTGVTTRKAGLSKLGYSFVIGILSVALAYGLGIPLGLYMARRKGRLADRLGTVYIVAIMAVPTLAYIFLFRSVGQWLGLPGEFDVEAPNWLMFVLPVVSLGLPAAANLMKWLRRYTVDQMSLEYVRFARACGLGEGKVFRTHVLKNGAIPLIHGIPASILGALVGAIITERVYVVPGAGDLLTEAIGAYDNGVIVGVTLFYAVLSVAAVLLGDLLLSMADPRIRLGGGKA